MKGQVDVLVLLLQFGAHLTLVLARALRREVKVSERGLSLAARAEIPSQYSQDCLRP